MKMSRQSRRDAKQLFRSCQVGGLLDAPRVRQTVQAVLTQRPRGYLAILSEFQRLLKVDEARRAALIESAEPLSEAEQTSIRENLARVYGPGLNISFAQKPALLGGVRIKVGSDVYDGSVQARLQRLQETF